MLVKIVARINILSLSLPHIGPKNRHGIKSVLFSLETVLYRLCRNVRDVAMGLNKSRCEKQRQNTTQRHNNPLCVNVKQRS